MILLSFTALRVNLSLNLSDHFFEHLKYGFLSLFPRFFLLLDCYLNCAHLFFGLLPHYQVTLFPLLTLILDHLLHLGKVVLKASFELFDLLIPNS